MPSMEQLEKLLAADPDDVFLNFGLAMALAKDKRFDESISRFSRVIELDPDYVTAYFQQAKTLLESGDREGAKQVLSTGAQRAAACGDPHAKSEMDEYMKTL